MSKDPASLSSGRSQGYLLNSNNNLAIYIPPAGQTTVSNTYYDKNVKRYEDV